MSSTPTSWEGQTVTDRTLLFDIASSEGSSTASLPLEAPSDLLPLIHWRDAFDGVLEAERLSLNEVKSRLDPIPESTYYNLRDLLFPLAHSGAGREARHFSNRAGYKLNESMTACGVWEHLLPPASRKVASMKNKRKISFADICGGPGAFSQALFSMAPPTVQLRGFGMTLLNGGGGDTLNWYPALTAHKVHQFVATFGTEGTGNIYATENLHSFASMVSREPLLLAVADGGFDIPAEKANFQEAISGRIVFSQWLTALLLLKKGGCFVLKLFDTFAPITRSMLYLSARHFYDRVHVVKPKHSRVVNSERYLVCLGFRCEALSASWRDYLLRVHAEGFTDDERAVQSLVPLKWMNNDAAFVSSITKLNSALCNNQSIGLTMILTAAASPEKVEEANARKRPREPVNAIPEQLNQES